ncbi:MAG: efflux RND transporter permease subunit [Ignavibacterium sp.]|uniref:efflux RND transporter permease subunit n=1 Tax=Ignavibacterium sp. TaxID=2651167 RepID=UPI004049C32A
MPLPSTSIKRPVTVAMFYIAVALLGIYAFSKMGVDLLPDINIPHLLVQTTYPNASPEEIEKLITEPLESTARTVNGVKNITSVSKEGISVISLDFVWGTDMNFALLSLREKLDNARFILPREASRPSIIRIDPSASPIMTLVISYKNAFNTKFIKQTSSEDEIKELINLREAARVIFKRRLEQIDGVAQAIITGGIDREILIEVDLQKLLAYNITFTEISSALKSANVSLPAGSIMKGLFQYSLRTVGEFRSIEDIGKTIIKHYQNGSVLFLKDVANLKESFKEREGFTRYNGSEAVGILVHKEPDANTVEVANNIRNALVTMKDEYPSYDVEIFSDYSKFIINAIENVKQEIYLGGILAFIVLFFFLKSIRNILIIGITIPASLLLTVLLMYLFNIRFNIISLGGMAIGVGMLLDNAIIVIENVSRYREQGFSVRQAALFGSNEVSMPIVASTLTTIAVFLPLIFVRGIAGELFKDQSYAIVLSLASSILVALTLIPMLASREKYKIFTIKSSGFSDEYIYINKPTTKKIFVKVFFWLKLPFVFILKSLIYLVTYIFKIIIKPFNKVLHSFLERIDFLMDKFVERYDALLLWSLNNRKRVLLIFVLLVLVAVFVFINIKKEFVPESIDDELNIEISYPSGTSLEGNSYLTSEIEKNILRLNGVKAIISNIGRVNEFDLLNREQNSINKASLLVKLNSTENFYQIRSKIASFLEENKRIKYAFKPLQTAYNQVINPSKNDIAILIKNNDIDEAFNKGAAILNNIKNSNVKGLYDIRLGIEKSQPEYRISINRDKVASYGINLADAANQIVSIVKGIEATTFQDFDKRITIRLKALEGQRNDLRKILESEIIAGNIKVKVKDLVDYKLEQSYNEIWRDNQSRTIYLYGRVTDLSIDKVITSLKNILNSVTLKPGEIITISGVNEEISDSFSALYIALFISVLLMYMVLATEFESFLFPFIVILSIPMGLIGSILLLYVFGESINIISIMGLIILVGIADNDAVVKVEFILRKRKEGIPLREAIIKAGRDRFRPIVMNSFTVIFALIPMIIGIGAATQLRVSLAIALAGGLLSATFLTLIIIPVLYSYLERFSNKKFNDNTTSISQ